MIRQLLVVCCVVAMVVVSTSALARGGRSAGGYRSSSPSYGAYRTTPSSSGGMDLMTGVLLGSMMNSGSRGRQMPEGQRVIEPPVGADGFHEAVVYRKDGADLRFCDIDNKDALSTLEFDDEGNCVYQKKVSKLGLVFREEVNAGPAMSPQELLDHKYGEGEAELLTVTPAGTDYDPSVVLFYKTD